MARCCGSASCACILEAGQHIQIGGSGSAQDPFVVVGDVDLAVADNTTFNLTLTGAGTVASPWTLFVAFAATASVKDLPDVSDTAPTNGQVLVWNNGLGQYVPGSPTPAASGSVNHDTSLTGDGSPGDPLGVVASTARFIASVASGIGLSDAGINRLVRRFGTSGARAAASPVVELNTLSVLDTEPGRLDYWDGAAWKQVRQFPVDYGAGEFYAMSGSYAGGTVTQMVRQVSFVTDGAGNFTALSPTDLASVAGVLSVNYQETGGTPYKAILNPGSSAVVGTAYRLDTGAPYAGQVLSGVVTAWLY